MALDAASVWSLCDGDPLKISEWCSRRIELGLCQEPSEIKYIRQVMGSCHAIVDLEVRPVFQAMNRNANAQHQAFLRGEKARVEAWDERRQLMAEREAQRRAATSYEVIRQRVAAAPKPAVDTLQRQRLERSLKATPAMTEPMTTTPATKSHSRRARGECGVKLGKKIDRVLAEIREHQAACESTCCAPVAVLEKPEPSTVDPPTTAAGALQERAPVEPAGTGGSAGFINQGTAWDVMSGQGSLMTDLREFLGRLDDDPRLRGSANLRTMSRVREQLERIPEMAGMGDPVELRLQDVLVLMNQLMARMR